MVQPAQLEGVLLESLFGVAEPETSDRSEEACAQDHLDIQGILHPLEVIGGILNDHAQALLHTQVIVVYGLEKCAPDAKLLVRWQDEHLRDGQWCLGNLQELIEGGRVRHELVIHVDEEVVPEGV